jgi:hypothetical protein
LIEFGSRLRRFPRDFFATQRCPPDGSKLKNGTMQIPEIAGFFKLATLPQPSASAKSQLKGAIHATPFFQALN